MNHGSRRADARAIVILVALISGAVAFRWYYDNWIAGYDMLTYFLPSYEYLGQRIREFQIPAWNPHQNSGYPAAGDPGAAWLYLPVMAAMFVGKSAAGIKLMVLFQALIAGLATYGFARKIGLLVPAAFLGALAYAIGPPLYDATGQSTVIGQISTFVPVGFLAVESAIRTTRRSARLGWSVLGGLAMCQMFLAWPQGFMYGSMFMVGWLGYRTLIDYAHERRDLRTRIRFAIESGVMIGLAAALLGAGGILPRLDFSNISSIPGGDYSNVIGGEYVEWRHSWPEVFNNYFASYVEWRIAMQSAVLLLLAFVAICYATRRFGIPFFVVTAFLAIDLSVDPSYTRWVFYLIPPFEQIHHHRPTATMYMIFFPLVMLTAIGLHLLLTRPLPRWRNRRLWIAAGLSAVILLVAHLGGTGIGIVQPLVWLLAIGVIAIAATHIPAKYRLEPAKVLTGGLVALLIAYPTGFDVIDVLFDPTDHMVRPDLLGKDDETQEIIELFQATESGGLAADLLQEEFTATDPFRYAWFIGIGFNGGYTPSSAARLEPGTIAVLANGRAVFLGLEEIAGYNPIHLNDYVEFSDAMNGTDQNYHWLETFEHAFTSSQLLDMLGVRYVLVDATIPSDRADVAAIATRFVPVSRNDHVVIYANPRAFPRAWVVHNVVDDTDETLQQLSDFAIDGRTTALVDSDLPALTQPTGSVTEQVTIASREPESITMEVTADGDGLMVLAEVYEHNWKAWVNGEEVKILRTNRALRGIPVPAGMSMVELRYESTALTVGMWTTGFGTLAVLGIWTWAWFDRRRETDDNENGGGTSLSHRRRIRFSLPRARRPAQHPRSAPVRLPHPGGE